MSPSERGRVWPLGISHSSNARGSVVSNAAGTITRVLPVAVTAATKVGWPAVPLSVAISGARAPGTSPIYVSAAMLTAASVAEAMPKLRQKMRLPQTDGGLGAFPIAVSMRNQVASDGDTG